MIKYVLFLDEVMIKYGPFLSEIVIKYVNTSDTPPVGQNASRPLAFDLFPLPMYLFSTTIPLKKGSVFGRNAPCGGAAPPSASPFSTEIAIYLLTKI